MNPTWNPSPDPRAEDFVVGILSATSDYRVDDCDRLLEEAGRQLAPVPLIQDVLSPVLREAGNRWHRGELSVVQEHMLSASIRRQLSQFLDQLNRSTQGPTIAFSTLSGERHELGSLMLAVVAANRGFHTVYLGADLPVAEVCRFCDWVPVAAVALSIVTHPEVIDAPFQLRELRAALPRGVMLWLGGQSALLLRPDQVPAGVAVMRDAADFEAALATLRPR